MSVELQTAPPASSLFERALSQLMQAPAVRKAAKPASTRPSAPVTPSAPSAPAARAPLDLVLPLGAPTASRIAAARPASAPDENDADATDAAPPSPIRGQSGPRKILLVDDHDLVRMGIKALLAPVEPAIEWIEAATLHDAFTLYEAHEDVALVLLDLNLADCKGLQGLRQLRARFPQARVAILSGTHDEFVVRQAQAMGAVGYLDKGGAPGTTRDAVLDLLGGDSAGDGTDRWSPTSSSASYDRVAELGPRHLEILELVLSGCTNQEISRSAGLSLGTVKNYVSTILLALDVKSRSHLISLFR